MEILIAGSEKLGLTINSEQLEQFNIYYRELTTWNRRMNLTTITDYEEVQLKHFLDSLTITLALGQHQVGTSLGIIDVGTGAGLPGLPLKIMLPETRLVLLEATAKKATFLHRLTDELGMVDVEIITGRAEEIAHRSRYRENFDRVLSRGVAPMAALVELTLPFCAIGGSLIAQKKGTIEGEMNQATNAISLLGGSLREVRRIKLEEFTDQRQLIVIDKISPTPLRYPRRPGIPARRPLV